MRMHQVRLLFHLRQRGQRRVFERKKFKCLGEINSLSKIVDTIEGNRRAIEYEQKRKEKEQQNAKKKAEKKTADDTGLTTSYRNAVLETSFQEQTQTSARKVDRVETGDDQKNALSSALPTHDALFELIYREFDQLRSSGMSRKDLVTMIEQKDQKRESQKILSFWEGVLDVMQLVNQIGTFKEMQGFKDMHYMAEKAYHSEQRIFKKVVEARL